MKSVLLNFFRSYKVDFSIKNSLNICSADCCNLDLFWMLTRVILYNVQCTVLCNVLFMTYLSFRAFLQLASQVHLNNKTFLTHRGITIPKQYFISVNKMF